MQQIHRESAPIERVYMPRTGEQVEDYVKILASEPKYELDDVQRQEVLEYSAYLAGETEGESTLGESLFNVLQAHDYTDERHELPISFLMSSEGRKLLSDAQIIDSTVEFKDPEKLVEYLRSHAFSIRAEHPKAFKDLTLEANKAQDKLFATALVDGTEPEPVQRVTLFTDSTEIIRKMNGLVAYRRFLREEYSKIHLQSSEQGVASEVDAAKLVYVDAYKKVVNAQLAKLYPDVLSLQEQSFAFTGEVGVALRAAIHDALPLLGLLPKDYIHRSLGRMMMKLDGIRNGASLVEHRYVPISPDLRKFLEKSTESQEFDGAEFSREEVAVLDNIEIGTEDIVKLAQDLLQTVGKLSEHPSDESSMKRAGRAPDGKWQIFVKKGVSAMEAKLKQAILVIPDYPEGTGRSLAKATAPAGIVPALGHELTHIVQEDNTVHQEGVGLGVTIQSKRAAVNLEAGAIGTERRIQKEFFGRSRSDAPHYMKALDKLTQGESEFEAVKAFFDSYLDANPTISKQKAASDAVSRVKRLARRMGGFDSQPLDYVEGPLLVEATQSLPDEVKDMLFNYGGLSIEDLAKLHDFGLVPKNLEHFPYEEFKQIMIPFLKTKLAEYNQKQKS